MSSTYSYAEDDNEEVDVDKMTSLKTQIQSQIDTLGASYQRNVKPLFESYQQEVSALHARHAYLCEEEEKEYSERVEATWKKTEVYRRNHACLVNCVSAVLLLLMIYCLFTTVVSMDSPCWSNHYWNATVPVCQQALNAAQPMPPQCLLSYHTQSLCNAKDMASFRDSWSEFFDMLRSVTMPLLILSQLIFTVLVQSGVYLYYDRRYRAAWLSEFSDLRVREEEGGARRCARLLAYSYAALFSLGVLFWQLSILDSITIQWYQMACLSYASVAACILFGSVIPVRTFTAQVPRTFMVWQDGYWQRRKFESGEVLPGCYNPNPPPYDQNAIIVYWT